MRAIHVDFAPPPRWPGLVLWGAAVLLGTASSCIGARDWQQWQSLSAKSARVDALLAQLASARAATAAQAASAAEPPPFAADAKRWMTLAALDGTGVLRAVESARVVGAKMITIDVNAESRRVELEVEVTSAEVAAAYLEALNAGEDSPQWTLARLQTQGGIESVLIRGQLH